MKINISQNILVLSPHTDDAELGAGGSIVKFMEQKHRIYWVVFSTAEDSVPDDMPKNILKEEFGKVCSELNLNDQHIKIFNYPVRKLIDHRQDVLEHLVQIRETIRPDLVIGPSLNDFHQDHQVVANEMVRAFKSTSSIISYELPWNHIQFRTQLFVRLSGEHMQQKMKLLSHYSSQITKGRSYFSKEFVYGLAATRGVQIRTEYAEAFEVIRWKL